MADEFGTQHVAGIRGFDILVPGETGKTYRVATFREERPGRKPRIAVYTVWYNPAWEGCVLYDVVAPDVGLALAAALRDRKENP
jgi:hypothetical protein